MQYTFTERQLIQLVRLSVFRYEEYIKEYGRDSSEPLDYTVTDIIEGLHSELLRVEAGEKITRSFQEVKE